MLNQLKVVLVGAYLHYSKVATSLVGELAVSLSQF
jgi:hypothetical protein